MYLGVDSAGLPAALSWKRATTLVLGLTLGAASGCATTAPRRNSYVPPARPAPVAPQAPPRATQIVWSPEPLPWTRLEPTGATFQKHGRVVIDVLPIDAASCAGRAELRASVTLDDGRTLATCRLDEAKTSHIPVAFVVRNETDHVLRLSEAVPALLRDGVAHAPLPWGSAAATLRLAAGDRRYVSTDVAPGQPMFPRAGARAELHRIEDVQLSGEPGPIERLVLLPGTEGVGYAVWELPLTARSEAESGEGFTVGLWDVPCELNRAARASLKDHFGVSVRRTHRTIEILTPREVSVAAARPRDSSPGPAPEPGAESVIDFIAATPSEAVDEAAGLVGSRVLVKLTDGSVIDGELTGVTISYVVVRMPDGNRRMLELSDVSTITTLPRSKN